MAIAENLKFEIIVYFLDLVGDKGISRSFSREKEFQSLY